MPKQVWIRILPDTDVARSLKRTAERDVTEESILAEFDAYLDCYKTPIMMLDWIPGFFEGLVHRQPQTRMVYLNTTQVEVVHELPEDDE